MHLPGNAAGRALAVLDWCSTPWLPAPPGGSRPPKLPRQGWCQRYITRRSPTICARSAHGYATADTVRR